LQPYSSLIAKKQLQKQHVIAIAKKQLQKHVKSVIAKNQFKKLHVMTLSDCD
jgi:hypothetical protein